MKFYQWLNSFTTLFIQVVSLQEVGHLLRPTNYNNKLTTDKSDWTESIFGLN